MADLQPIPDGVRPHPVDEDPTLWLAAAAYLRAAGSCATCARERTSALLLEADAHPAALLEHVTRRGEQTARACVTNRHPGARP